jgi:hypothetical protein
LKVEGNEEKNNARKQRVAANINKSFRVGAPRKPDEHHH